MNNSIFKSCATNTMYIKNWRDSWSSGIVARFNLYVTRQAIRPQSPTFHMPTVSSKHKALLRIEN